MKKIIIYFFLLSIGSHAQKVYYKTFEGLILTEENYLVNKKEIEQREDLSGQLYEIPIKTEFKKDSIIKYIKIEQIITLNSEGQLYDPFKIQRKMIGEHFPIESFKNKENNHFTEDYLFGKPTVVNFWFTDCPPCVKEIPDLHDLKEEFGDSVNFIAITFEKRNAVDKFLARKKYFNYFHITDAEKGIKRLKIQGYPMTFLLNKDGEIVNVYGDLSVYFQRLREILLMLL